MSNEPDPQPDSPPAAESVTPESTPEPAEASPAAPGDEAVVVAAPPSQPPKPGDERPWLDRWRGSIAGSLATRKVTAPLLAILAVVLAGLGGACLAIDHYGLGAVLGLLSVAGSWLATASGPGTTDAAAEPPSVFARVLAHATVPLLLGGAVMEAASSAAPARAALGTWTIAVLLLLPLARAVAVPGVLAPGAHLWSFAERTVGVLAGFLLGHPSLALFLVACVASADLLLRLAVMRPVKQGQAPLPIALQGLFAPDGRPQPGVRLACRLALAVVILLYVVLGRSAGWQF